VFFRAVGICFSHHRRHAEAGSSGFYFALVSGQRIRTGELAAVPAGALRSARRSAPRPTAGQRIFFEFPIVEQHPDGTTSNGRIDLYRRARFVLESKQLQEAKAAASQLERAAEEAGIIAKKKSSQPVRGTGAWDDAMMKARGQSERYVRAIPNDNPPFLIVVDVGHSFEIYADFSQAGKAYLPFPDPRTFRIRLADLADEKIRERLRLIWTNPAALDAAKNSADVTREVSGHLAELAKSLEQAGHEPQAVAQFLTRCLFCMFAEDVELLPKNSFTDLLESLPASGEGFQDFMRQLFREMNTGTGKGISLVLRKKLLHFNGGLFADDTVLPINGLQLGLLKNAARQNWGNVEPAIFGTRSSRATVWFMGWFGPRGLASIVLALVYLEHGAQHPGESTIRLAVMVTVLLSIFAHGLSAAPGLKLYAARLAALDTSAPERQAAEAKPADPDSEPPVRTNG